MSLVLLKIHSWSTGWGEVVQTVYTHVSKCKNYKIFKNVYSVILFLKSEHILILHSNIFYGDIFIHNVIDF
jgi:hypothetical protein